MPIFEYQCKDCNTRFEILHKSSSNTSEVVCPQCNSVNYKKLLSTFSPSVQGSSSKTFEDSCAGGKCPAANPYGGCASGMCGLN
ncbi:MAG: FmdB family zinc ribbon protein [Bacillota bacterium]